MPEFFNLHFIIINLTRETQEPGAGEEIYQYIREIAVLQ